MKILLCFFLFVFSLQVSAIELNLPERFDVEVSKCWITENGVKISNKAINRLTSSPIIFHFNKNSFYFKTKKILYLSVEQERYYSRISAKGKFEKGSFSGKMISENWNYSKGTLHFYDKAISRLTAEIKSNGKLYIVDRDTITNECRTRYQTDKGWGPFKDCSGELFVGVHKIETDFKTHMLLQLPINQSQSTQTFIKEPKPEKIPMPEEDTVDTQPTQTLPDTTNMSMSIGAQDPIPQTETNPCNDPNQDTAMKEYCATKAYNKKVDEQNRIRDEIEEKRVEEELAREESQERQLETLEKEQAVQREALAKAQAAQREAWRQRQKENDQIQSDKLASDMQQLRQKHAEIKKARKIVDLFGEDDESKRLAHKKIDALKKKNNTLEGTTKIKQAIKKQFYDSSQLKRQGEAAVEMEKVKAWDKSIKRTETIRDSAMTANKVIAKLDPTGTGDKIVNVMEKSYETIEAYSKGGTKGVIDHFVEKKASDLSGGLSDTAKESIETYKALQQGKRIKLKSHEIYYNKDNKRITTYKKGERLYDKNNNEITYSYKKRFFKNIVFKLNDDHNVIKQAADKTEAFTKAVKSGNINSMINAGMELKEAKEGVEGGIDKTVNKLTGEGK